MDFYSVLYFVATKYGLFGFFFAALIANATILLPLPIELVVFAVGGLQLYNPVLLGLFAGAGAAFGELSGYLVGLAGNAGLKKFRAEDVLKMESFRKKIEGKGMQIIFIFALIPFAFDLVGIAAGLMKFDLKKFLIAALCGKILRYIIVASAGFYGIELVSKIIF